MSEDPELDQVKEKRIRNDIVSSFKSEEDAWASMTIGDGADSLMITSKIEFDALIETLMEHAKRVGWITE